MKSYPYLLVLVTMVILLAGCQSADIAKNEFTGMNKFDIVQMLGEPDKVEELVKNTEYIFGPVESLWDQIEMGEKIVIWTYETSDGYKELYFLNNSPEVAAEFFWYNDPEKNPIF